MSIARRYAEYATELRYEDLPPEVVDHAKKLILDIVANSIGGYAWMDSGPKITAGVRSLNRSLTGATVLATGEQMAPEWASLVNGASSASRRNSSGGVPASSAAATACRNAGLSPAAACAHAIANRSSAPAGEGAARASRATARTHPTS